MGPPAKCHLNGVLLVGQFWPNIECCLHSFASFQGILTSIAKETYSFTGVGVPPLDPCMNVQQPNR